MAFASTLSSPSNSIFFGLLTLVYLDSEWGFMIKFYFEVCPTFIESLFKTHDV